MLDFILGIFVVMFTIVFVFAIYMGWELYEFFKWDDDPGDDFF